MAANKIVYGGRTLIDLTGDSVTPKTMLEGATAHDKRGQAISGAVPRVSLTVDEDGYASFGFTVDAAGFGVLRCVGFDVDASGKATVT